MKKKIIVPFIVALFLAVVSCNDKEEAFVPRSEWEPETYVGYACPKGSDIYKLWPDTLFVNKEGVYTVSDDNIHRLHYEGGASFALMGCEGKYHDNIKAVNSPSSWDIKAEGRDARDTVWATQGTIRINQVLLAKDVDKVLALEDGEKMKYDVALLNFNQDTIQTNTITVIYKPDLQTP